MILQETSLVLSFFCILALLEYNQTCHALQRYSLKAQQGYNALGTIRPSVCVCVCVCALLAEASSLEQRMPVTNPRYLCVCL